MCLPFTGDFADLGRLFLFLAGLTLSAACGIVGGAVGAGAVFVYTRYGFPGLGRYLVAVFCAVVLLYAAHGTYQWRRRQRLNCMPPLVTCIHNRDLDGVRELLQSGRAANIADPNAVASGQTLLAYALSQGHAEIADILRAAGARD